MRLPQTNTASNIEKLGSIHAGTKRPSPNSFGKDLGEQFRLNFTSEEICQDFVNYYKENNLEIDLFDKASVVVKELEVLLLTETPDQFKPMMEKWGGGKKLLVCDGDRIKAERGVNFQMQATDKPCAMVGKKCPKGCTVNAFLRVQSVALLASGHMGLLYLNLQNAHLYGSIQKLQSQLYSLYDFTGNNLARPFNRSLPPYGKASYRLSRYLETFSYKQNGQTKQAKTYPYRITLSKASVIAMGQNSGIDSKTKTDEAQLTSTEISQIWQSIAFPETYTAKQREACFLQACQDLNWQIEKLSSVRTADQWEVLIQKINALLEQKEQTENNLSDLTPEETEMEIGNRLIEKQLADHGYVTADDGDDGGDGGDVDMFTGERDYQGLPFDSDIHAF